MRIPILIKLCITCCVISLLTVRLLSAQIGSQIHCESMHEIRNSTTLIVLDDSATTYNTIVKETIDQHWHISPVQYIHRAELPNYLGKRGYTMLLKNGETRIERRVSGSSQIQFNEIAVYPCNRGSELNNYHARDAYAKIRVEDIHQPASYLYKLDILLKAMHRYLVYADSEGLDKNNYEKQLPRWLNDSVGLLQDMTLYVATEDMPARMDTQSKIERYYDHAIRLIPRDSIPTLIEQNPNKSALLHLYPNVSQIYVVTESGQILYGQAPKAYKVFERADLMMISRAVEGKKLGGGFWDLFNKK